MVLDQDNSLILPIMRGTATCYSFFPDEKIDQFPLGIGSSTVLMAGLQVRFGFEIFSRDRVTESVIIVCYSIFLCCVFSVLMFLVIVLQLLTFFVYLLSI